MPLRAGGLGADAVRDPEDAAGAADPGGVRPGGGDLGKG